jgi:hypothetical protein
VFISEKKAAPSPHWGGRGIMVSHFERKYDWSKQGTKMEKEKVGKRTNERKFESKTVKCMLKDGRIKGVR